MPNTPKKKVFYQIDEACSLLGFSSLDMAVLVSERKLQLCATVGKLLVEDGHYEVALDDTLMPIPNDRRYIEGLVELRPEDAWYVLRAGSQPIFWLAAEDGCYRRLVSTGEDDRGYTVIRDEVGVRHGEPRRIGGSVAGRVLRRRAASARRARAMGAAGAGMGSAIGVARWVKLKGA